MFYLGNILIIGFILLIAYWWANQGVFSALLHLIAVILAGTVALAFWEPLTMLLVRGNAFDDYAPGIAMLVVFVVVLLITRLVMDKLVRSNVILPRWANLVFGFPLGLAAGILTIGIFLIGAGHIQSHRDLLGVTGYMRSTQTGQITKTNALWFPAHEMTADFYDALSVGSLSTSQPLRQYNPDLGRQAMALRRDSFDDGRAKLTLTADAARIVSLVQCENDPTRFLVEVDFRQGAKDFGDQLTLSSSQIRLLGKARGSQGAKTVHPDRWSQNTSSGFNRFDFDNAAHYITSIPGQDTAKALIEFGTNDASFEPRFIQIRGTRFSLPVVQMANCSLMGIALGTTASAQRPPMSGSSIQNAIQLSDKIKPIQVSTNQLPAGVKVIDKKLSEGEGVFSSRREGRISRGLQVKGFYAPKNTSVVQLTVQRNGPVDLYGPLAKEMPADAPLHLVDTNGITYSPIGYMHLKGDEVVVKLVPGRGIQSAAELPILPSSGAQTIKLIYTVTDNVTIAGFRWGDRDIGMCSLFVEPD